MKKEFLDLELNKTLEKISEYTHTKYGKDYLKNEIKFYDDYKILKREIEISRSFFILYQQGFLDLRGTDYIKEIIENIKNNLNIEIRDYRIIANFHSKIKIFIKENKNYLDPITEEILSKLNPMDEFVNYIYGIINEDDQIDDNATSTLSSIRKNLNKTKSRIIQNYNKLKNQYSKYLSLDQPIYKNGRLCLCVSSTYRRNVNGIVVGRSDSGNSLYIEPSIIAQLNEEIIILENEEKAEISRILSELRFKINKKMKTIENNIFWISYIDYQITKTRYALDNYGDFFLPSEKTRNIKFSELKHPLISKNDMIPINIDLKKNGIIITGPNTGGKTVTLKSIGLAFIMAHMSLPVLSVKAEMPFIKNIFTDIGDEQSISQNLSTFSSHLKNLKIILEEADEKSIVIIDELGTGTDPIEGAALGISIIKNLIEKNSLIFITSHLSEIKTYSLNQENLISASMSFDINSLKPTYVLQVGVPGASHAIEIAQRMGFPDEVIEQAKNNLGNEYKQTENVYKELGDIYSEIEQARKLKNEELKELSKLKEEYEEKYEKVKNKEIEKIDKEIKNSKQILKETKNEIEKILSNIKKYKEKDYQEVKNKLKEIEKMNENLNKIGKKEKIENKKYSFKENMIVLAPGNNKAKIVKIEKNKARLKFFNLPVEMTYDLNELKPIKKEEKSKEYISSISTNVKTFKPEIDIRGYTVLDAIPEIENLISDLLTYRMEHGYIIHGKGTGKLAEGIWKYLRKCKDIKSFRIGKAGEGGTGVTVVEV